MNRVMPRHRQRCPGARPRQQLTVLELVEGSTDRRCESPLRWTTTPQACVSHRLLDLAEHARSPRLQTPPEPHGDQNVNLVRFTWVRNAGLSLLQTQETCRGANVTDVRSANRSDLARLWRRDEYACGKRA